VTGQHHYLWTSSDGGNERYDSCWVNGYDRASGLTSRDYSVGCLTALAQQDGDGTGRILGRSGDGALAFDATTHALLWQDSILHGGLYTGTIGGCGNERLLVYGASPNRFRVYDASDGSFIDSTSRITGVLQSIIKRPMHPAEFMTWVPDEHTVNIYTTAQPDPMALTCSFIPESNLIHLAWPDLGATQYYIYSSSTPGTIETLEATIPAPQHSYDLTPQGAKRFYHVTAEYSTQ
jgi:hypothetical protein